MTTVVFFLFLYDMMLVFFSLLFFAIMPFLRLLWIPRGEQRPFLLTSSLGISWAGAKGEAAGALLCFSSLLLSMGVSVCGIEEMVHETRLFYQCQSQLLHRNHE